MLQLVKDPTLSLAAQVQSPALYSGLKIRCCHNSGVGRSHGSDLIPGPGTSIFHGCSQKRKKNRVMILVSSITEHYCGVVFLVVFFFSLNKHLLNIYNMANATQNFMSPLRIQ